MIGPGLIGRRQTLAYTWITVTDDQWTFTWGRKAPVTITSALVDTSVRPSRRNIGISLGVVAGVTALIYGLWYGWLGLASYLSSGRAHTSLGELASKPIVLIGLLPLLIPEAIHLLQRYLASRRARRSSVEDDDLYFGLKDNIGDEL